MKRVLVLGLCSMFAVAILSFGGLVLFNGKSPFANNVLAKSGLVEKKFYTTEELFGVSTEEHSASRQREIGCAEIAVAKAKSSSTDAVSEYYKCSYNLDVVTEENSQR